jgi:hypothetical protein
MVDLTWRTGAAAVDEFLKIVPLEHLVQLMSSDQGQHLSISFVQFLGNVVATTDSSELVMHAGILPPCRNMLHHPEPNFRAESCFILSNLLPEEQYVDKVIAYEDILPTLIKLMEVKAFATTAR